MNQGPVGTCRGAQIKAWIDSRNAIGGHEHELNTLLWLRRLSLCLKEVLVVAEA